GVAVEHDAARADALERLDREAAIALVVAPHARADVDERVVGLLSVVVDVHAAAAAEHRLAVSTQVPREADAGLDEERRVDALDRGVRVTRVPAHAGELHPRGEVARVARLVEDRDAVALAVGPRLEDRQARAVVEREARAHLPRVLREELP